MGYFKPPNDASVRELRKKGQRSAKKKWEYINVVGVWLEVALFELHMARNECELVEFGNNIHIADPGCAAAIEVF